MNLRSSFDYLKNQHFDAWKAPYNIKCIFLMVVLRISDYIQIHSERADPIIVKTKRFSSPISIMEWQKHGAIKHINIKTDDPERIYVFAKPENSLVFLELKKLFHDIQYEFDLSWAILGEVYGKDDDFKNLKIVFRRITSNLDDVKRFEKSVEFIPEKIRFDADPELLKLLIGPLYGEDPKYGVRELLQNSVDAVKERAFVDKRSDEEIKITIEKNNDDFFITILDNGIGMTKDTIINFFFRAGASFRNSMIWKKSFVENSSVKIEKTGRFGVGVLAIFLLGDEFEMRTRYYKSEIGYSCKASLSTKQVELLKTNCEIGTFLKIRLNDKNTSNFKHLITQNADKKDNDGYYKSKKITLDWFNWYFMNAPKLTYEIKDNELKEIFRFDNFSISSDPSHPLKGWYSFSTNDFKSIHWTISSDSHYYYNDYSFESSDEKLFCNGFKIVRGFKMFNYPWKKPIVSVFDGNARMPLSLSRDYLLNDRLPFEEELVSNICYKVIEKLLQTDFIKSENYWIAKKNVLELSQIKVDISEFVVVRGEYYTLMAPFIFQALGIKVFYQLWLKENQKEKFLFNDKDTFYQAFSLRNDPNYLYKNLLDPKSYGQDFLREWFSLGQIKRRNDILSNNYILNDKLTYMKEGNRLSKTFRSTHKSNLFNERWVVIKNYSRADDDYGRKPERKKKIEKAIKGLNEDTKIIKNNLTDRGFYYVKENYLSLDEINLFEKFKTIWEKVYGQDEFMIPINKEFRYKLKSLHD